MALFDIFKKKPFDATQGKKPRKTERVKEIKAQRREEPVAAPKPKKISGQAYGVLEGPHITEKATDLTAKNQYIFEIFPHSNKSQVKKAVEDVYGVDVIQVRIINVPPKKKRLGRIEGWRSGYRKAMVKIKEGQKIEVLPR